MPLPKVTANLRSSAPAPNPQDLSAFAHVIGPASAGPLGVPRQINSLSDLSEFGGVGGGPGPELVAEILQEAGGPVLFTRSTTTTASVTGAVTKTDPTGAVGTAQYLGGALLPGSSDANGLQVVSKVAGVTFRIVVAGNGTALSVPALGAGVKDVVVNSATDGGGAATSTATLIAAAIAAQATVAALINATALGTGATVPGAQAQYSLDKGALLITPKVQAARIKNQVSGNSTALDATTSGSDLTIVDSTGASGLPTGTASQVKTKIEAVAGAAALVTVALVGDGTGLLGPQAAFVALQFGSTAAMSLTGTANDGYELRVQCVRAGALGATPAPTIRWAVDRLDGTAQTRNWSSETPVPVSGIVVLANGARVTGLTATFTGTLAAEDLFSASTTVPESGTTDLLTALDAALAETRFAWGFVTSPCFFDRAGAAQVHTKLQAARNAGSRFVQALLAVRNQDVANSETEVAWESAVITDFQGYVSPRGLVTMVAGPFLHASPLTLAQYKRPLVFAAAARKAAIPIHENLGRVGSGPLSRVLYLYHDESKSPALFDQRFVVALTYPQRTGSYYLAGAPTMADPNDQEDAGYTLYERVAIALGIARIASSAALTYLNDSLPGQAVADRASGSVAGALALIAASQVETRVNQAVETFVYRAKSDGKASASALPPGEKMAKVRRDNNFLNDGTINMDVKYIPLGLVRAVVINVFVTIPQ